MLDSARPAGRRIAALALAALLAGGCGPGESSFDGGPQAQARIRLHDFRLGTALGTDGAVPREAVRTEFEIGDVIHLSMRLEHAPPGTPIRAIWRGPGDEPLGEETKRVRPGQVHMHFSADSGNLPPGRNYRVAVSLDGRSVTQLEFHLE